jgi:hypothetical protein
MRVEVLGGVERRRRWSRDDKMRIIEETLAPGAVVTEIARRHGIATNLVFTWRRRARLATAASAGPRLVPVPVGPRAAISHSGSRYLVWSSLLAADPCNGHSGPSDRTPIALAKCLR